LEAVRADRSPTERTFRAGAQQETRKSDGTLIQL
jgi:hypothetical protein